MSKPLAGAPPALQLRGVGGSVGAGVGFGVGDGVTAPLRVSVNVAPFAAAPPRTSIATPPPVAPGVASIATMKR